MERISMPIINRAWAAFQARRKWLLQEMSDRVLAVLGAVSFLIAGYWTMAMADVLPDLVRATNRHGITVPAAAAFLFLAGLGITIWFHATLAKRCHDLLVDRHFR